MNLRKALLAAAACLVVPSTSVAKPIVEVASQAGPHGTAQREWLQRLAEAGAGPTRLVSGSGQPRLDDLGTTTAGKPLVKVHAVLTRRGELLLPGAGGPERFGLGDRQKLAAYFERLEAGGATAVTASRGRYDLTKAQFTELFTRLQAPLPPLGEGATLQSAIDAAQRAARVEIAIDAAARPALASPLEGAASLDRLAIGTALAAALRQEGLAVVGEPPASAGGGSPARNTFRGATTPPADAGGSPRLRVVAMRDAVDPWPVGYDPEGSPTQTAPALMEFLTVEVEGYTLAEALDAIGPRVIWQDRPLAIVWDRFAMRRDAIDPAAIEVHFPRKRTFYKRLLDQLASQGRLKLDLRVDEAGTPLLWLTR